MSRESIFDMSTGEPILSEVILDVIKKQYADSKTLNHEAADFASCLEKRLVVEAVYSAVKGIRGILRGK